MKYLCNSNANLSREIINERFEIHKTDTVFVCFWGSAVPLSVFDDISF